MVASIKLLHLLEAFSTPWFLFSAPSNHHLVFFLLEIFNNIIQYQFDGNSNLVYTIIRKRQVFHSLANLPTDLIGISKCLHNRKINHQQIGPTVPLPINRVTPVTKLIEKIEDEQSADEQPSDEEEKSDVVELPMEGSRPALPAEPGTLKVSLLDTPAIGQMTERESAHPIVAPQYCDITTPVDELKNVAEEDLEIVEIKEKDSVNFF